jgi:hypothetical protein
VQIGRVEHVANAKHPFGELDVAANLAAAGNASRVCGDRSADSAALVDISPGTANIAADITPAPPRRRRGR